MSHFDEWAETLPRFRKSFQHGAHVTQDQIDEIEHQWLPRVQPSGSEIERLQLVDQQGQVYDPRLTAPRWLAHLLGLRHRAAHVLLLWESPGLGPVMVCQVRSFKKKDFPGHIDVSVGGHVVNGTDSLNTSLAEMDEELGIQVTDLAEPGLFFAGEYECTIECPERMFLDVEWRDVFLGRLSVVDRLCFQDGEVDGVYLCPLAHARLLLEQSILPVANGLKRSLPLCLSLLEKGGQRPK